MKTPDVLSIGEPMVELCATSPGRLSVVEEFKRGWGGDTSNFAVATARLGGSAGYVCRLGGDEFGRSFLDLWRREGVDASRVIVEPDGFTAVYIISFTEGGGHDFTYYRAGAAASRYSPRDLDTEYVARAKVLHTSGISLAVSGSLREASLEAMRACREAGGRVSFDVNMRLKLWPLDVARAACGRAVGNSDVVFASVEDTHTLYGVGEPEGAAEKLRSLGAGTAVIKRGGEGCHVSSEEASFDSPGYSVDVVDTTGSGDAFDAAFMLGLLGKWGMEKSAAFANAVGALTVTGLGAVAPIPTRERALGFMASRRRI